MKDGHPKPRYDRGAAAVEFAIVLTVLIPLLMGMMEFGYLFFQQGTMAGAAREAARSYAISKDGAKATDVAVQALAIAGIKAPAAITITGFSCITPAGGGDPAVTVVIEYSGAKLTGFFGSQTLKAKGTMRCGG